MNKRKGVILTAVILFAAVVVAFYLSRRPKGDSTTDPATGASTGAGATATPDLANPASPGAATPSGVPAPAPPNPRGPIKDTLAGRKAYDTGIKNDRRVTHTDDGKHFFNEALDIARQLHTPDGDPEEDVSTLNDIMAFYRMIFAQNPVAGDNQSVMAALMGDNERGIVVFPADHPSLDGSGQLLDRWESPYFFHALSRTNMEIISLGPDQILGTYDDLSYTERDYSDFLEGLTGDAIPGLEEEE
jgi:hypothetical protein